MPLSYFTRDADTLDGYDSTDFLKTGSNILTGSQHISGSLYVLNSVHANDFTGSLTRIDDGIPYLLAGPYITILTNSIGQIEISGTNVANETYWISNQPNIIATSGSALISGSLLVQALSASNGAIITGSFVQGNGTFATGQYSHAQGFGSLASGLASHAEGFNTTASNNYSHAEGLSAKATAQWAHAEGDRSTAAGQASHAEGALSLSSTTWTHAEGFATTASAYAAHSEGYYSQAQGLYSHAEGYYTNAISFAGHAEGAYTTAGVNNFAHAEGLSTTANGYASHAEGLQTTTTTASNYGHAEGRGTTVSGDSAHAEGQNTTASGYAAHAEGYYAIASGYAAHAEGYYSNATGNYSHAEGYYSIANGPYSHAEGLSTKAYNSGSFAIGNSTEAVGAASLSAGTATIASGSGQVVIGKYNKRGNDNSLFVIGDGVGTSDILRGDILRVNPGLNVGNGRIEITGTLAVKNSIQGSLTTLTDGSPYLLAGNNITLSTGSNGAVTISAAAAGALINSKQIAYMTIKNNTAAQAIGQFSWVPSDYTGLTSVKIRAIMSTDGTANHTGSLQIYNLTSGSYLDLVDTPSTGKYFVSTGSTPTLVTSSNLLSGITNFNNNSTSIYEIRISGSMPNNTIIGGVELIFI